MPDELDDGKCPFHGTVPVEQSEENYFFLLSKAAKDKHLYEEIESEKRIKVRPETRKNEVLSKIKNGLEDVSISRAGVDWGIPFPEDPKQTVYVWVDALLNYLSATEIYEDGPTWPADLHLMAKDILWFHAIIWPAMLLAAGYELPKMVYAHGFFTIEGKKMSKSLGNAIDPNYLVKKYGRDAVRYAILREFPFGEDGDISEDKIANRYTADLANGLGNLLNRTLSMINRYELDVENATPLKLTDVGKSPDEDTISTYIENLNFSEALSDIWTCYIKPSNELIDKKKPWELIKTDKEETESVLRFCYDNLLTIKSSIEPFMPEIAQKMGDQLETKKPDPLFPRLES
jgi:methionyl-tRNA synthetase